MQIHNIDVHTNDFNSIYLKRKFYIIIPDTSDIYEDDILILHHYHNDFKDKSGKTLKVIVTNVKILKIRNDKYSNHKIISFKLI
jgi:hypothetical protein